MYKHFLNESRTLVLLMLHQSALDFNLFLLLIIHRKGGLYNGTM